MSYPHKLPTFRKILLNFASYSAAYVALFALGKFGFPEIPVEVRLKLNQIGITMVYVAGLLASLTFYWSSKARENASISAERITSLTEQIGLLEKLSKELRLCHLRSHQEELVSRSEEQEAIKAAAIAYPMTLEKAGIVSVFALAAGTMLQLFSLA